MEPGNYWGSWLLAALGVWEICAPNALKYGNTHFTMFANAGAVGGLMFMFAFWEIATDEAWGGWALSAIGAWLALSAVIFENGVVKALLNDLIVGLVTVGVGYLIARHGHAVWERGFDVIETEEE